MINTALRSTEPFFVSIHNGARLRHLARACQKHHARREVSVQVRARRFREHEVVRGVAGAHSPFGPDHLRYVEPRCALVGARPALQQPSRKTQETPLLVDPCLRCGSFLYHKSVGGRGCGQQPDAFFPQPELPRRRGESLVGVRVHHSCWLCLTPSLCVFSAESRHCFVFLLDFICQQNHDELALFLVLSVCVIEFLGHVERMTDENKRDHNAASLFEFGGAICSALRCYWSRTSLKLCGHSNGDKFCPCVVSLHRVVPLRVNRVLASVESRRCFVFIMLFSAESRHCFVFLLLFSADL